MLRLRDRAERQAQNALQNVVGPRNVAPGQPGMQTDSVDEFPSLGAALASGNRNAVNARYTNALKSAPRPGNLAPLPRDIGPSPMLTPTNVPTSGRQSTRIHLRPPALMPTLATGSAVGDSYAAYRSTFLDLGAARAKALQKAAECWKRGDGAGAKTWSKEAAAQDRQRIAAGRDAAKQILAERKATLRKAVITPAPGTTTEGRADVVAERGIKGRDAGASLGVLLGVAAVDGLPTESQRCTVDERTEVAVDLHGLHGEEAIDFLAQFLAGLERESFYGLAFLFTGRASHSTRTPALTQAVVVYLEEHKYAWRSWPTGVTCVDPLTHA